MTHSREVRIRAYDSGGFVVTTVETSRTASSRSRQAEDHVAESVEGVTRYLEWLSASPAPVPMRRSRREASS